MTKEAFIRGRSQIMEFNPLDLLAKAAELQQQHSSDNSGDPSSVKTKLKRPNSFSFNKTAGISSQRANNNKDSVASGVKNNGLRKLHAVAPSDLEKMLDEHNYGNAKKGNKHERGLDLVSGEIICTERNRSVSVDTAIQSRDLTHSVSSEDSDDNKSPEGSDGPIVSDSQPSLSTCNSSDHVSTIDIDTSDCQRPTTQPGKEDIVIVCTTAEQAVDNDSLSGSCRTNNPGPDELQINSPKETSSHTAMCLSKLEGKEDSDKCVDVKQRTELRSEKCGQSADSELRDGDSSGSDSVPLIKNHEENDICKESLNMKEKTLVRVVSASISLAAETEQSAELEQAQTLIINISKKDSNVLSSFSQRSPCCSNEQESNTQSSSELIVCDSTHFNCTKLENSVTTPTKNALNIIHTLLTSGNVVVKEGTINLEENKSDLPDQAVHSDPTPKCTESADVEQEKGQNCIDESIELESMSPNLNQGQADSTDVCDKNVSVESNLLKKSEKVDSEKQSYATTIDKNSSDEHNLESGDFNVNCTTNKETKSEQELCSVDKTEDSPNIQESGKNLTNCDKKSPLESDSCISTKLSDIYLESESSRNDAATVVTGCDDGKLSVNNNNGSSASLHCAFTADHCYAEIPGKGSSYRYNEHCVGQESYDSVNHLQESRFDEEKEIVGDSRGCRLQGEGDIDSLEDASVSTPSTSGDLSQDSGYGDTTQSPDSKRVMDLDSGVGSLSQFLSKKNVAKDSFPAMDIAKVLPSATIVSEQGQTQEMTLRDPKTFLQGALLMKPEAEMPGLVGLESQTSGSRSDLKERPTTPTEYGVGMSPLMNTSTTPSKFGKFKIGTYASFSNTGFGQLDERDVTISTQKTPSKIVLLPTGIASMSPQVVSLLVDGPSKLLSEKYDSPDLQIDNEMGKFSHITHDHDYCTKNLMPLTVTSMLEGKMIKEVPARSRGGHFGKLRKQELENQRGERYKRSYNRRSMSLSAGKDEDLFLPELLNTDSRGYESLSPTTLTRPKSRAEKYIEQKSVEPKVKITGSNSFKDQFVYFMNTKTRSRRRESRDSPVPLPADKVVQPPKPGDIVVPHLTDADIEVLKLRSRQKYGSLSSTCSVSLSAGDGADSVSGVQLENAVDEESKIINTILSLESESLQQPHSDMANFDQGYNSEGLCLYGQSNDLLNQMNLTPEQMEILYSAVEEVQNSSPGLVEPSQKIELPGSSAEPALFPSSSSMSQVITKGRNREANMGPVSTRAEKLKKPLGALNQQSSCTAGAPVTNTDHAVTSQNRLIKKTTDKILSVTETTNKVMPANETTDRITQVSVKDDVNSNIQTSVSKATVVSSATKTSATESESPFKTSDSNKCGTKGSPIKKLLESHLISTPTLPANSVSSDLTLPHLDRSSLEMLGNDFKFDKTDLFQETSTVVSDVPTMATSIAMPTNGAVDYDSPWIVTVSMFWNDLPAIMINNLPYIRLVDIHKQILPAKDTGILKKRCQLLRIPVLNCTEMQRYFLVQYGKAFNSKSTLIVSKDDAKVLIGYYVNPPPKMQKTDGMEQRKEILGRLTSLNREHPIRSAAISSASTSVPVIPFDKKTANQSEKADSSSVQAPKAHTLERKVVASTGQNTMPSAPATRVVQSTEPLASSILQTRLDHPVRSTRNKKINFLELLRGDSSNQDEYNEGDKTEDVVKHARPLKRSQTSTESSEPAKRLLSNSGSSVKQNRKVPKSEGEDTDESSESETDDDSFSDNSRFSESSYSDNVQNVIAKKKLQRTKQEMVGKKSVVKPSRPTPKSGSLKIRWTLGSSKRLQPPSSANLRNGKTFFSAFTPKRAGVLDIKDHENILFIRHKDSTSKNGHSKSQLGEAYVDKYENKKSICIRCYTCQKFMSVENFLCHLHDLSNNGHLLAVTQPQILEPRDSELSENEKKLWDSFQRKKELYDNNQLPSPYGVKENETLYKVKPEPEKKALVFGNNIKKMPMKKPYIPDILPASRDRTSGVRVSSRKRKEKQLYPFENYTFVRKLPRLSVDMEEEQDVNVDTQWERPMKTEAPLGTSVIDTKRTGESVVTIANGPELTTFTALQEDHLDVV